MGKEFEDGDFPLPHLTTRGYGNMINIVYKYGVWGLPHFGTNTDAVILEFLQLSSPLLLVRFYFER